MIHVVYGPNYIDGDLHGFTVGQVIEALSDILNVGPSVKSYFDGRTVDIKFRLPKEGRLELNKEHGKKGALSKEDIELVKSLIQEAIQQRSDITGQKVGKAMPRWDEETRCLCVGDKLIKQFRRPAESQTVLLSSFEEEGWPKKIFDPLPGIEKPVGHSGKNDKADETAKNRLRQVITALNSRHVNQDVIRFRGDGTGEAVIWEVVEGD